MSNIIVTWIEVHLVCCNSESHYSDNVVSCGGLCHNNISRGRCVDCSTYRKSGEICISSDHSLKQYRTSSSIGSCSNNHSHNTSCITSRCSRDTDIYRFSPTIVFVESNQIAESLRISSCSRDEKSRPLSVCTSRMIKRYSCIFCKRNRTSSRKSRRRADRWRIDCRWSERFICQRSGHCII